jgi:hypothetical protein
MKCGQTVLCLRAETVCPIFKLKKVFSARNDLQVKVSFPRKRESSIGAKGMAWIPAFAGMTTKEESLV